VNERVLDVLVRDDGVGIGANVIAGVGMPSLRERAADLQPDVVVMDVRMPGLDGIEATRRIAADSPHIGVVVLTMSEEDATLFAAMRTGARGYLLKGANQAEIGRAITAVAQDGHALRGGRVRSRRRRRPPGRGWSG
jgi:DNA-binding NarL/FixJ family response regulator